MYELSMLANMAEILGVLIVIGGLYFAVLQMRHLRQQRRELAAIELFRFFGNPDFARAYQTVLQLPDRITAADLRQRGPAVEAAAMLIGTTMENIGVMTFQRIVPFLVVSNLIGNSAVVLWCKLQVWAATLRREINEPAAFEWFEWLSDRLQQYQPKDAPPAYEAFRDWQPKNTQQKL